MHSADVWSLHNPLNVILTDDKTFQIRWWSHKWRQIKSNENKCHLSHSFPKADIQLQAVCALAHLHQIQTVGGWDYPQATPCVETIHRPLFALWLFTGHSLCWDYSGATLVLRLLTGHSMHWDCSQATSRKEAATKALCNPPPPPPPGSRRLPAEGAPAQVSPCRSDSLWNWNY